MSSTSAQCPIWGTPAEKDFNGTRYVFDSSRAGGAYQIDMDAKARVESLGDEAKARLTTILIDQRQQGIRVPLVTNELIAFASAKASLPVYERAARLLQHLTGSIPIGAAARLDWNDDSILSISESCRPEEVLPFLRYLEDSGWIQCQHTMGGTARCEVTVSGYGVIESIHKQLDLSQAFIAMWINDDVQDAYISGIRQAICNAGYKPYRVDEGIAQSPDEGKIDDTIIAEIRRSRFIVADFTHGNTGIRGSVYYEAGFAHGLGIPVIYSCRQDQIERLHFDTRQYYHIAWGTPEELREGLEQRILAMVGQGPLKNS